MNDAVVELLNKIMEMELAGVVRYTHYSLMVYGFGRIPIVSWLRGEAQTSLQHAQAAGELVTHLGAHPSLAIGPLLETRKHEIGDILRESIEHESKSLALYHELLSLVQGESVMLEEYARKMIFEEEQHLGERSTRCCGSRVRSTPSRVPSRPRSRPGPSRRRRLRRRGSAAKRGRSRQLAHLVRGQGRRSRAVEDHALQTGGRSKPPGGDFFGGLRVSSSMALGADQTNRSRRA
jgi:bacterioferritin